MVKKSTAGNKAYDKKFYNNLLRVARDVFQSYTIMVPNLQTLAMVMEMPFSDAWMFALHRFAKSNQGFVKRVYGGYIIEVIPF